MVEITTDDTFNIFKSKKFGYLGGRDFAVSDDGLTWSIIQHYTDLSLTNPSTALINGYYYIADDTGIRKTKDFNTFFDVNAKISDDKHSNLNNFEWFQDLDDSWYIKYNADTDTGTFTYYADFDETTDSFVNAFNQFVLPTGGASGLQYVRGKYYIWQSGDKLYRADNFIDKFEQVKTDIVGNVNHKQFSSVVSDNYLYVYFAVDDKTYVRSSKVTNMIHWSEPVEVDNVELGSYFYNHSAISVYPDHDKVTTFDKVLKVTANGFKQKVPISCMVLASLQVQWEQNSTYQISFTAFDDGSVSYTMLSEEAQVEFNGQTYVIKQAVEDASGGVDTKAITASHIYNEINRVRQRKTKTGTLTYSVQDVLSFYLDDKVANSFGFTWSVFGDFDKQQIENLGNSSGSDMLAKIIEQWPQAIIYPDNKLIRVYSPESFAKDYGGRIDYLHNSSDVKMTVDSTTITNQVKVFGKQIENTSDNADDNAPVKYYFEPFIVSDQASIDQYGLHPMDDISDERFTDRNAMQTFAKGQLSPNPAVSIEATMEDNEVPYAGEKRHLIAKPLNLETDLTVIGYTWYPFDNAQKNSLSFANLPASILQTQANTNNRIRKVQLMAQQAINAAKTGTRNFVSPTDPMKNDNNDIRTGDIWTLPLDKKTKSLVRLDKKTKSLVRSVNFESEDDSDTNQTIYTDPEKMDKINVQFSIWNGSQWLELSNQRTTNKLNDNINSVTSQVQEAQAGIATAVQQAQNAGNKANQAITDAGFATDTATTAKQVADSAKDDVADAKSDSATALQQAKDAKSDSATALNNAKTALTNATDAKSDSATALDNAKDALNKANQAVNDVASGKTDISNIQDKVNTINSSLSGVSDDLDTAKADLKKFSDTAVKNGKDIVSINKDVSSIKIDAVNTKGNVSQLQQTATKLSSNITDAQGNISRLQQKATSLSSSIKDNSENISNVKQTATKLSSDITDAQGNISRLQQKADSISSTVGTLKTGLDGTNKTVKSQGTQITQNATALTSKADKTDVDAVTNRVTTAETNISQNAKDIESKANNTTVNTLTGKVTQNTSDIKQNAKGITSKVSSSDVQGMLDDGGYATQSWTGSQIKQSADEINSTVTSVSNKVDNLQIGGRNLLADTSDTWDSETRSGWGTFSYKTVNITEPGVYTASVYLKPDKKSVSICIRVTNPDGTYHHYFGNAIAGGSEGYSTYTVQVAEGQTLESVWITFSHSQNDVTSVSWKRMKLEKGNKATDWSPAPEDMATVTALSNLSQTVDGMQSDISKKIEQKDLNGYATQTWAQNKINSTADGIKGTISSVKNTVEGHTTSINDLKADSSRFKSQFTTVNDTLGKQSTDISTLQATSKSLGASFDSLSSDNQTNQHNISQLQASATEFSSTLATVQQQVTDSATVTALSNVDQKVDSISSTVTNNKSDADSQFTNIKQTIGGIQSTVKNKADSSAVTQLSNVVDSKVSTKDYNSEITQLADDIDLRVKTDDLISQINLKSDNVLIQAGSGKGKLYLDANSTIFSGKAFIPDAAIASLSADKLDVSTARIGSGSNYIDMTGGSIAVNKGNTSTTLNGNNIFIGRNDNDNRYRWGTKIDRFGLSFGVPAKQYGSDSKWNYETQGYLSGDGWNYNTADMTGNGESGIVLGITSRQDWGNDNGDDNHIEHAGGDYFQLGKYLPTNNNHDLNKRTFLPALIYMASSINTVAGGQGLHVMSNLIIHDTGTMRFYGNGRSNNGIYFDKYGNVHGSPGSSVYRVNDKNNRDTFAVDTNGRHRVWFGLAYSDGGGSLYSANNNGWYMRNHDGSYGNVYAKGFVQRSTIDLKKNIEMADTDKLANDIYNMDVAKWKYKEETSQNAEHIGAVIGGDYHINSCLLSDDKTGVNTTSLTFALVATVQKQAKQISELMATVEALKIKNGD